MSSLGSHIRGIRLKRSLTQHQVGQVIGVCSSSIVHWEAGHKQPNCRHYPAIFSFLGYIPSFMLEEDSRLKETDFGKWLRYRRQLKGLTVIVLAKGLGVISKTVYEWEENVRFPYPRHLAQLQTLLDLPEAAQQQARGISETGPE